MNKYKKHSAVVAATFLSGVLFLSSVVLSHCEIPCGIYDDTMRINMMFEHIQTIEKSMRQIHELSEGNDKNYNQLTRWIINKENHSDQLSDIVTQYFMKQRIAPVETGGGKAYDAYIKQLTLLHKLMVYSMKCKQTTELDNVTKLRETLTQFKAEYPGVKESSITEHKHSH